MITMRKMEKLQKIINFKLSSVFSSLETKGYATIYDNEDVLLKLKYRNGTASLHSSIDIQCREDLTKIKNQQMKL